MRRCWPLLALLMSCGGKSYERSPAEGAGANGGAAGSSATGGRAGGSAGAPAACAGYDNQPGRAVMVRLTNVSTEPLYLGPEQANCGFISLFRVYDQDDNELLEPGICTATCQDIIAGNVPACGPLPCIVSHVLTLQPGESVVEQWAGQRVDERPLPSTCQAAPGDDSCLQALNVAPGQYLFSTVEGHNIDCSTFGDGKCTECMPSSSGGCTTFGAVIAAPKVRSGTVLDLDESYFIPPGGGMSRVVQLDLGAPHPTTQ